MAPTASPEGSSTSARRRSPRSPRSGRASRTSPSPGEGDGRLTPGRVRALATRHGVRPRKALGQHFLIEPRLAERIVELAGVRPRDPVLEIGAGLGSLTVALARAGARVLAVELDPGLVPALEEVIRPYADDVRVAVVDAMTAPWHDLLDGPGPWAVVANLPYNVAVPVVLRLLEEEPRVDRMLVMVQREVGERLAAAPGQEQFGAVSLRVAYRAGARVVRRVPATVFWPRPNVESVLVRLIRRPPPVDAPEEALWALIREGFAQRRKMLRTALVRSGYDLAGAEEALRACGLDPRVRAEQVSLEGFACLARAWLGRSAR